MDITKFECQNAVETIQSFIANKKHGFAYCTHNKKSVLIAQADAVDRELCAQLGYNIMETMHTGGVVVVADGDVSVIHFGNIGDRCMLDFAKYLVEQYKARGLNATFDGNDVLIDGYKISGLSATPYGHIQYSTIHIGVNTNLDDIKAICTKPMVKIPKGLNDYGITTEEIEQIFLDFCGATPEGLVNITEE